MGELIDALRVCTHPLDDPKLKKWQPSPYYVASLKSVSRLVEYRLKLEGFRIIVGYFDNDTTIILGTATLVHDHAGMQKLLREHAKKFSP
jgi:hypothetical protein